MPAVMPAVIGIVVLSQDDGVVNAIMIAVVIIVVIIIDVVVVASSSTITLIIVISTFRHEECRRRTQTYHISPILKGFTVFYHAYDFHLFYILIFVLLTPTR